MKNRMARIYRHLNTRARILSEIRRFFENRQYLEVETPCRIPAPMPEAAICPQPSGDWFLQTSPEVCMKQLLAGDMDRIFQICRAFRQQERGNKHLPEFTLLEWYRKNADYQELMTETEHLVRFVAEQRARETAGPAAAIAYQGRVINVSPHWPKITVAEAFDRYAGHSLKSVLSGPSPADRFDECMGCDIEPQLGWDRPVFIYDYPASLGAAYARLKPGNPDIAERFELYIGGLELCNGFSELTGQTACKQRFEAEDRLRRVRQKADCPMPQRFLDAMKNMPEAAGNALGIDRLVMLLCDTDCIDDVVAFTPEML